jgi:hypothetical protein
LPVLCIFVKLVALPESVHGSDDGDGGP